MSQDQLSPQTSLRPLRILCADDDILLADVMLAAFYEAGHVAEFVANGLEAWMKISNEIMRYDVLVTDNQMPGLSGLELVELLRQTAFPGRIIVHSGAITSREEAGYKELGVHSIIPKFTRSEEFATVVKACSG